MTSVNGVLQSLIHGPFVVAGCVQDMLKYLFSEVASSLVQESNVSDHRELQ